MQLSLPDGTLVLAHGRLDLVAAERPRDPDFALYLEARWDGDPQVAWVREHYHRLAVETIEQEQLIAGFGRWLVGP